MGKIDISVRELVDMIDRGDLQLPELQRKYVWKASAVRDLLDSLYRGYPSGTILVWETEEDVPQREFAVEQRRAALGSHKLLLDGQQRLTSLLAVLKGVPIQVKNRVRPIELLFNLEHSDRADENTADDFEDSENDDSDNGEEDDDEAIDDATDVDVPKTRGYDLAFAIAVPALLSDPHWVRVSDIFNPSKSDRELLGRLISSFDDPRWDKYTQRLQAVRRIADYVYVMQVIERTYSYREVADVFVRVNSLGTRLRGSDLALAQITASWRGSLKRFEDFADEFDKSYTPDIGTLVRTLVVFATGQCRFRTVASIPVAEMRQAWEKGKTGLRFALNFIRANAGIEDTSLLSSWNLLIPIALYAVERGPALSVEEERGLLHWLLVANATGHYTRGSTESILDVDIVTITRRDGKPTDLIENVRQRYGRLEFTAADFVGTGAQNPLFATTYLALRAAGAKDWSTGLALQLSHVGRRHGVQTHHIFPNASMKEYEKSEVNEIANLAFLSSAKNQSIGAKTPDVYMPEIVERRGDEALRLQGIPTEPRLWRKEEFPAFLEYRRAELAEMVNAFIASAGSRVEAEPLDIEALLAGARENESLELKETCRVNSHTNRVDKEIEHEIVKTVAAFLNSGGGSLVIGVTDEDMKPVGLARDFKTLGRHQDSDGLEQFLRSLLSDAVVGDECSKIKIEFPKIDGVEVCVVDTPPASHPTWTSTDRARVLYVRSGNTTQALDGEHEHRYIQEHFQLG